MSAEFLDRGKSRVGFRCSRRFTSLLIAQSSARLLNDLIRPLEQVEWNCETNLFGRFEVDDELKLRRLLHRQVSGLRSLENLVNVLGGLTGIGRRSPLRRTSNRPD